MIEQVCTSESGCLPQGECVFVKIDWYVFVIFFFVVILLLMQLQNSRTIIQERERFIRDLEEKVAFLEAEVRDLILHFFLTSKLYVSCTHEVMNFSSEHRMTKNQKWVTKAQDSQSLSWSTLIFIISLCLQNREMHDHMEYFLAGQDPPPHTPTENKPEVVYRWGATFHFCYIPFLIVFPRMIKSTTQEQIINYFPTFLYSKPLTPTTLTNKALPFIKVVEIKSWMDSLQSLSKMIIYYVNTYVYLNTN